MWETKDMLGDDDMKQIRIAGDTQTYIATLQRLAYMGRMHTFHIANSAE